MVGSESRPQKTSRKPYTRDYIISPKTRGGKQVEIHSCISTKWYFIILTILNVIELFGSRKVVRCTEREGSGDVAVYSVVAK